MTVSAEVSSPPAPRSRGVPPTTCGGWLVGLPVGWRNEPRGRPFRRTERRRIRLTSSARGESSPRDLRATRCVLSFPVFCSSAATRSYTKWLGSAFRPARRAAGERPDPPSRGIASRVARRLRRTRVPREVGGRRGTIAVCATNALGLTENRVDPTVRPLPTTGVSACSRRGSELPPPPSDTVGRRRSSRPARLFFSTRIGLRSTRSWTSTDASEPPADVARRPRGRSTARPCRRAPRSGPKESAIAPRADRHRLRRHAVDPRGAAQARSRDACADARPRRVDRDQVLAPLKRRAPTRTGPAARPPRVAPARAARGRARRSPCSVCAMAGRTWRLPVVREVADAPCAAGDREPRLGANR
jgi:hypothetical protein